MTISPDQTHRQAAGATPPAAPGAGGNPATPPAGGNPGDPQDPGGDTPDQLNAKEQQIQGHIGAVRTLAEVPETTDPTKKLVRVANPYGKQLTSFALGAALTVEGCASPFARFAGLAQRLRQNSAVYTVLVSTQGALSLLLRGVSARLAQVTGALVTDIGLTVQVTDATLKNPGTDPQVHLEMERSSEVLQQLRDGRASTNASKARGTKAAAGKLTSAQTTINKLTVSNKYLGGEELKPEDVIIQPPAPPPAKHGRRGAAPPAAEPAPVVTSPQNPRQRRR